MLPFHSSLSFIFYFLFSSGSHSKNAIQIEPIPPGAVDQIGVAIVGIFVCSLLF